MSTSESPLLAAWRGHLSAAGTGLHLADPSHPLQIFIGKAEHGAAQMVVRSSVKPVKPRMSNAMLVNRYVDNTGMWSLAFTLQDPKFTEVFLRLADDIHARTADSLNEAAALDRLISVVDEWRRLLKPRPSELLTIDELRGLVGELWLVVEHFSRSMPIDAAVEGWLGPLGLPQDFWYAGTGYHEAKSVGPAASSISITSAKQLDASPLQLLVLTVPNAAEEQPGAVTMPTLVRRIENLLTKVGVAADCVTERMIQLGVNLDEPAYHETWFAVTTLRTYLVAEDFPSIRSSNLAPGVERVTYQLQLSALAKFLESSVEVA